MMISLFVPNSHRLAAPRPLHKGSEHPSGFNQFLKGLVMRCAIALAMIALAVIVVAIIAGINADVYYGAVILVVAVVATVLAVTWATMSSTATSLIRVVLGLLRENLSYIGVFKVKVSR